MTDGAAAPLLAAEGIRHFYGDVCALDGVTFDPSNPQEEAARA